MDIPSTILSEYFRSYRRTSFYHFLNQKRVKTFKEKVANDQHTHLDLLGITYESGFGSKATFNRAFKNLEGITPKEYRARAMEKKKV
ncbi:helix-turn-helix domain-containing protein [Fulvivirgaceae bacterium BMA10]|uniref:Helix-turn-helix domain-containing protein n=1 Tax=Splendidivirga corallicola TaxID=3051826 RepID=A0ABT8KNX7_9BACT|nr:helix-turn-helix domain-containing protein [Fulvivirgaceae bacterium BMA10]